ncbi:NACHT domain-containing protein [Streptomyces exfoliatus]|uniref:NACHT domain-containing protein n=1 Tax=Streptomyces exfoliatus TaxID=1905 RepID=UPI003C30E9C7
MQPQTSWLWNDRLVEVWAWPGKAGSGVAFGARGVLTARHLVAEAVGCDEDRQVLARLIRWDAPTPSWVRMRLVADDADWDLAILEVDVPQAPNAWEPPQSSSPIIATVGTSVEPNCEAVGFPDDAVQSEAAQSPATAVRQTEQVWGTLLPMGQAKVPVAPQRHLPKRWVPLDIFTAAPLRQADWGGMSGAGVVIPGSRLVGIVVGAEADHQQRRLFVVPLATAVGSSPLLREGLEALLEGPLVVEPRHGEEIAIEASLGEYRQRVALRYGFLTLAGIPVESDNLRLGSIRLKDVYVKLEALPESGKTEEGPVAVPLDTGKSAVSDAVIGEMQRRWREPRLDTRPQEHLGSIAPEDAVLKGPASVVILGPPGAGKSTMMRMLAVTLATSTNIIPVYANLSEIEIADCHSLQDAALNQAARLFDDSEERHRVREALALKSAEKCVCFLFDALDEVHSHRNEVWEQLRIMGLAASEGEALHGARIVVTSRPTGYTALPFAHYRILPLLPKDSQRFIEQWFSVLASTREPPPESPHEWIQNNTAWLVDQLEARPQLRDIASNPLMLTFLALYAGEKPRDKLPEHRKDLYREYVERLFTGWESRRTREKHAAAGSLGSETQMDFYTSFIYRVAYRLHLGYYGASPDDSPTERKLVANLLSDFGPHCGTGPGASTRIKECLDFWRTAGLLRKTEAIHGKEWYLFRHQTFQEYGAARALAEQNTTSPGSLWTELENHRSKSTWSEVIPLALGCLADFGQSADSILVDLLKESESQAGDGMPGTYLAASCVAEGAQVNDALLDKLLAAISRRALSGEDQAFSALASIGWSHPSQVLSKLEEIDKSSSSEKTRLRVAEAKAKMQPRSEAIKWLRELISDMDLDPKYRMTAAWALGRLGVKRDAVATIGELLHSVGCMERMVDALGEFGTEESFEILKEIGLSAKYSSWDRREAAGKFAKAGRSGPADEILTAIIEQSDGSNASALRDAIRKRAIIRGKITPEAGDYWR